MSREMCTTFSNGGTEATPTLRRSFDVVPNRFDTPDPANRTKADTSSLERHLFAFINLSKNFRTRRLRLFLMRVN